MSFVQGHLLQRCAGKLLPYASVAPTSTKGRSADRILYQNKAFNLLFHPPYSKTTQDITAHSVTYTFDTQCSSAIEPPLARSSTSMFEGSALLSWVDFHRCLGYAYR